MPTFKVGVAPEKGIAFFINCKVTSDFQHVRFSFWEHVTCLVVVTLVSYIQSGPKVIKKIMLNSAEHEIIFITSRPAFASP